MTPLQVLAAAWFWTAFAIGLVIGLLVELVVWLGGRPKHVALDVGAHVAIRVGILLGGVATGRFAYPPWGWS